MQIRNLFYSNDKFSDENQLRFGVSLQTTNISLYDKDGSIMTLYEARLFFKNIRVLIYIDNIVEADLLLDTKSSNNTINYWEFDCKIFSHINLMRNYRLWECKLTAIKTLFLKALNICLIMLLQVFQIQ